jgi:uncharacterized protein (AIM24 family)
VLAKIKTVDGAGSGLDADTLDGMDSTAFATAAQGTKADAALPATSYTVADVLAKIKTVDGAGSGLDADTLDGMDSTAFATAAQGTKADAALPATSYTAADVLAKIKTVDVKGSGLYADTAADYTADGGIAAEFTTQSNALTDLAGSGRTTETVKGNADAIVALSNSIIPNELLSDNIQGTIQYPTIVNSQITQILHKTGSTVIRSDVFTYSVNLITEVRTIVATGATVTFKYHLDTLETEVI